MSLFCPNENHCGITKFLKKSKKIAIVKNNIAMRIAGKVSRYVDASMNRATPTNRPPYSPPGDLRAGRRPDWPGARHHVRPSRRDDGAVARHRRARHLPGRRSARFDVAHPRPEHRRTGALRHRSRRAEDPPGTATAPRAVHFGGVLWRWVRVVRCAV